MQVFLKSLKPKVHIPIETFIASDNIISTTILNPSTPWSLSTTNYRYTSSINLDPPRSSHSPIPNTDIENDKDQEPLEGRTQQILDRQRNHQPHLTIRLPEHNLGLPPNVRSSETTSVTYLYSNHYTVSKSRKQRPWIYNSCLTRFRCWSKFNTS